MPSRGQTQCLFCNSGNTLEVYAAFECSTHNTQKQLIVKRKGDIDAVEGIQEDLYVLWETFELYEVSKSLLKTCSANSGLTTIFIYISHRMESNNTCQVLLYVCEYKKISAITFSK